MAATPITDEEIIAEIEKQSPLKIEWDHNEGLDAATISDIVRNGQEAVDRLHSELIGNNLEQFSADEDALVGNLVEKFDGRVLAELGEDDSPTDRKEHISALVNDHTSYDPNIGRLAKLTGRQHYVIRACEPVDYQSFQGLRSESALDDVLEILQISPHHFQNLVPDGVDITLPEIPERDGKNAVDIDAFRTVLKESNYGGELVFLCGMGTDHVVENIEGFHTQAIRIHKGTPVALHCYLNGATALGEAFLTRDLIIPHGKCHLHFDGADGYGVQACCNLEEDLWKKGHASPESGENAENKG